MRSIFRDSFRWSIAIGLFTFFLGSFFTVLSTAMLSGVTWGVGLMIVLFFVFIGVLFDAIGLAAAAADEVPFRAMASERIKGAKHGIYIVRNAAKVSSFCNDVIGDICGIVSGSATAYVVLQMMIGLGEPKDSLMHTTVSIIVTSIVAALTVGGKAFGKSLAIRYSTDIILWVGKFFYILEEKLRIRIWNGKTKKRSQLRERR